MLNNFKICTNLDECLSQIDVNPKLAVAISLAHASNSYLISSSQLYCFNNLDIIYEYAMKFLVNKNFTYFEKLNDFIGMASAGGLIEKWYSDGRIRAPYKHVERVYGHFLMEQMNGILIIWSIAVMIAIISFLNEFFVFMKSRAPNPSRLWIISEMLIDPDRHFWLESKWK